MAIPFDAPPPYEYKAPNEILKGAVLSKKELEARQKELTAALQIWVEDKDLAASMTRKEIARLEGSDRIITLSKGLIANTIRLCRQHKRSDCRMAVLAIVHLFSDNDSGLCRLSVARFAQILGRKEDNIRIALRDLEEGREIVIEHSVHGNSYWPNIHPVHAKSPSMGWFADALSDKPKAVGRPAKTPPRTQGDISSSEKYPPADGKIPPRTQGTYITNRYRYSLSEDHEQGSRSRRGEEGHTSKAKKSEVQS